MEPYREAFWNIGLERYSVYLIMLPSLAALFYGLYRHYRLWRVGRPENRFNQLGRRLWGLLGYGFAHTSTARELYPGLMHLAIFIGILLLFIATIMDTAEYWLHLLFGISYLRGTLYLYFSLFSDMAGVLAILGGLVALFRRYLQRPPGLDNIADDAITLTFLLAVSITGFLVEGLRIAATELVQHPDWAVWSPVGFLVAQLVKGLEGGSILLSHRVFWWVHQVLAQTWVGYLPYSKLSHIIFSGLNILFRSFAPKGELKPIMDFETAESFGAGKLQDLTWKQLLDADACTRCGRCQDNCPAWLTGKLLSPKKVILDLKAHLLDKGPLILADKESLGPNMVGEVILDQVLWECTTCGACQEHCPVFIEHVGTIIDMRRHLVMMESRMSENTQLTLTNLERRGHPWRGTQHTRLDWAEGLEVPLFSQGGDFELLYWVGCTGALEDRSIRIARAMARLMRAAGVRFGVLGDEETCCGDPARRFGNEYLYQMLAQQNIETFKRYGVRKIVTHCPHGFNTFKNEYSKLGGEFEVMHHSQFLLALLREGRLKPHKGLSKTLAYHDSCYLGRHNGVYAPPRELLKAIPGIRLVEMKRSLAKGLCCGAGGGHLWMEEEIGTRVNHARTQDVIESRAQVVGTACPFCIQMLEDGIKAKNVEESLSAFDLAELLAASL